MKVVFRTNLGSMDAKKLGLKEKECRAGATVDVHDKDVAESLIKDGLAVTQEDAKTDPLVLSAQGVPDKPEVEPPTVTGLAKPAEVKGVKTELK